MKLNKTQAKLLRTAADNRHGVVCTHHGYYAGRKNSSYGRRDSDAACALRDAGLLEFVQHDSGRNVLLGGTVHDAFQSVVDAL